MSKPRLEALQAMEAAGQARRIVREVVGYETFAQGNVFFVTDSGEVLDKYITVRDYKGALVAEERQTQIQKVVAKIRRGAAGILSLLESPAVLVLERVLGFDLGRGREAVKALAQSTREQQIRALIRLYGSERLQQVEAALTQAEADGVVTPAEWAAIVRIAKG